MYLGWMIGAFDIFFTAPSPVSQVSVLCRVERNTWRVHWKKNKSFVAAA